jgi:hypothetical protein
MSSSSPNPVAAFVGTPLGQFAIGAFALVVGAAMLFGLIGMVSGDGGPVVDPVAGGPTDPTEDPAPPTDPTTPAVDPTDGQTTDPDPTDDPDPTEDPDSTDAPGTFDPSTIAVQVLDAVPESTVNHRAVVACLRDAGYTRLIDQHRAARAYEMTAVFYTPGGDNIQMARQVAAVIGVADVQEKPDNLSDSVPVHVVVGRNSTNPC